MVLPQHDRRPLYGVGRLIAHRSAQPGLRCVLCLLWLLAGVVVGPPSILSQVDAQGKAQVSGALTSQPDRLTIAGDPLTVHVGSNTAIQVYHRGYVQGQVYGDADSGVFLWVDGLVYGPNLQGTHDVSAARYTLSFETLDHSGPSGQGTASDPWVIETRLRLGDSGLSLIQKVAYVQGEPYFRLLWLLDNGASRMLSVDLFHAADIYFAGDDFGYGYYDPASGAVGGYNKAQSWYMIFHPDSRATHYQEGPFRDIWSAIGGCREGLCALGPGLNDTIYDAWVDNGIGLQWRLSIDSGERAIVGDAWVFGEVPVTPEPTATILTPVATSVPTATRTPAPTLTPTPLPEPVTECYGSEEGDAIYLIDARSFSGYTSPSASGSPLIHVGSPPAPEGWNQPGYVPTGNWQAAKILWHIAWEDPGWGPIIPGVRPIGLVNERAMWREQAGVTQLIRKTVVLTPPAAGMRISRAVLEMWSDNKTAWWWQGRLIADDREGYVGALDLVPEHIAPRGGTYVLAIQNSNDQVTNDNPQGTAFRLCVTWEALANMMPRLHVPMILVR